MPQYIVVPISNWFMMWYLDWHRLQVIKRDYERVGERECVWGREKVEDRKGWLHEVSLERVVAKSLIGGRKRAKLRRAR